MANTADFAPDILPQSPDQINSVLNQTTPTAPGGPVKGGLRSVLSGILQNFSYGAGQAMKKQAGLPTDQEIAMQNAALAHTNAQTQLAMEQADQMKNLTPVDLGDGTVVRVPTPMATKLLEARIKAQGQVTAAGTSKRFMVTPAGLFDTQNQQMIPGSAAGITITPEIAQQYGLPSEYIGKPMKLTDLSAVKRSDVFANVPMMTDQGAIVVNRKTSEATPVTGPGGQKYGPTSLASPYQVGDPNNPGQTVVVKAGQAYGMPGTQSASVQVPRKAAVAEVPTNIGNQKVAFNTAIQHADLLRQAARALNNGDQQQLNELQNKFGNAFGQAGPITAQAIADAYGREVTSVLSKGHMTDSEIATVGKTINPTAQNFQQIDSVLGAYQNLAQSKMNMLDQQTQSAVTKSQPAKPNKNVPNIAAPPSRGAALTDSSIVQKYLSAAGGNKDAARKMAQADGWKF